MNRIWLEIERDDDQSVNHERADKFTDLLVKLGSTKEVWFNEADQHYCIATDDVGGFVELTSSGHWFNLDALSV
tara:strand:- start:33 stop:254 length:222 start_codon:yes stop_codon:yes gene_type:complete